MKVVFVAGLITLLGAPAGATTVKAMSEAEMVGAAAVIVRGVVAATATRRTERGLLVTDVTVRSERLLKASASSEEITFTLLGGSLEGVTLHLPGSSHYRAGERVLLFLERNAEGLVELGVGAGKFRVWRDARGEWVERELGGVQFVRFVGGQGRPVPAPAGAPELLTQLESRIERLRERQP